MGDHKQSELTGVDWLTRVNRVSRCIRKIERSRTVSFKVPEPLHTAYLDLPSTSKTTVKAVIMGLIYALARKHGQEIECEDQLKPLLSEVPSTSGHIIINANISTAQANPTININIKKADIDYLERLIHDLLVLLETKLDVRSLKVIKSRVARAENIIEELKKRVN